MPPPRPVRLTARAPAKVNLCLHVVGRRADGYHELDSLVAFAEVGDLVHLESDETGHFLQVSCRKLRQELPIPEVVPLGVGNLAWRALALFARAAGSLNGFQAAIEKTLPSGAGLGGGSSDAAAVIALLTRVTGTDQVALRDMLALGADVPVCYHPRPWRVGGIGEKLTPVQFARPLHAVLVWPGAGLSTGSVFAKRAGVFGEPIPQDAIDGLADDPVTVLAGLRNDLSAPAEALEPGITEALQAVRSTDGCQLARMSGSGSAVFGLYPNQTAAKHAANRIRSHRPTWWVCETVLHNEPIDRFISID